MVPLNRRQFLKTIGTALFAGLAAPGYAFGIEPFRLNITRYKVRPHNWPGGLTLKIAALADLHACNPWMTTKRIRSVVEQTNALVADMIVLLGDYSAGHHWVTGDVHSREWAAALSGLSAPLGVHAIMGNHDWWEDLKAQRDGHGPTFGQRALEHVGINVYENDVARLEKDGHPFWLAGLGDQLALLPGKRWGRKGLTGVDDLKGTLAKTGDNAPIILLAHEPDIFPQVPDHISLTLAGHTHGGQIRTLGYSPVVPSRYGNRYAYGHVVEVSPDNRLSAIQKPKNMIISGGLGCSIMPVRFGMPPEIVLAELA